MGDLVLGQFQGGCQDQNAFALLELRHDFYLTCFHIASPSLHLDGKRTEFINGEKFLVRFQSGQNAGDFLDFLFVVRVVARQADFCFPESESLSFDDFGNHILADHARL